MSGLDAAGSAVYARQQMLAADAILDRHHEQGTMCSCGRTTPCAQALAVSRRRSYFVGRLARLAPAP